jgi:hypothetical protein
MGSRKIILVFAMAILSLSAGLVVGWAWTPLQKVQATAPAGRPGPRPWFDQLQLAADQQKQMDKIWGDARAQMQKLFDHRWELEKQRDQQIAELLSPSELAAYDKINQDFRNQRAAADQERDALLADANARSRALLDDSQKEKWDIISKDMRRRHGPMGPSTQRSTTTMPSNQGPSYQGEEHEGHHD